MLTTAQLAALRTAVKADANLAIPLANKDVQAICAYLHGDSTFVVWRSITNAADVFDAVSWASLTPTDAPDATATYTNRALMCQAKQINLQILLQGKDQISTGKANIRAGLQDALTGVPSGVAGVAKAAGWPAVKATISRNASIYEKVFATGTGTAAAPGLLVVDGLPQLQEVATALFDAYGNPL